MTNVARLDADTAWAAFMRRDRRWDGRVIGAVKTTGIYCKPSCPARRPKREHVDFFARRRGGARRRAIAPACAASPTRSAATARRWPQAVKLIEQAEEPPKLAELAEAVGYAPHHFQRLFKRDLGVSPAEYARGAARPGAREAHLKENGSVTDAIYDAGYSGPSGFYSDAKERLGMTPSAWRDGGRGETIRWTTLRQPARADADRGDREGHLPADLRRQTRTRFGGCFPNATIVKDDGGHRGAGRRRARRRSRRPPAAPDLPIDVAGTAFQEAVWRELRKIPPGETRSYAEIAAAIGQPKAVRAVGTANGDNHVAVLIPCHRVIRSDGTLGGYAGGLDRSASCSRRRATGPHAPELPLVE